MTWVKICGITREQDAYAAVELGADALGFNFYRGSARYVSPDLVEKWLDDLPGSVEIFGVFVNEVDSVVREVADRCGLDRLQLHGDESLNYCTKFRGRFIKAHRMEQDSDVLPIADFVELQSPDDRFLLDTHKPGTYGGTGLTFDWKLALAAKSNGRLILSGGLNSDNIRKALVKVQPFGVDVSSGIEENAKRFPGQKSREKMAAFIEAVRAWDYEQSKKAKRG